MKRRPTSQRVSRTRATAPFQPVSSSDRETEAKRWSTAVVALENADRRAKRMATARPQQLLMVRATTTSIGSTVPNRFKDSDWPHAMELASASWSRKPASSHRCPRLTGLAALRGRSGPGRHLPEADGCTPERVVAGETLSGHGLLESLLHPGQQRSVLDHRHEHGAGVPHIEEVPLPRPLEVAAVAEPTAPEPWDLVVGPVGLGGVGHLLPQPDDLALLLIDEHPLIRVDPAFEPGHLQAEGDLADLLTA